MWTQDKALAAYRFAAQAHHGQTVPGTDLPYLLHVSQVAMEVMAALCAEGPPTPDPTHREHADRAVLCALLHDVVEDTAVTLDDVGDAFGAAVAAGVAALSKDPALPAAERMADSLRRIQQQPRAVWLVKLADRVVNLQPPPAHWTAAKQDAYRGEARRILAALGPASPFLAARLAARIDAY